MFFINLYFYTKILTYLNYITILYFENFKNIRILYERKYEYIINKIATYRYI